MQNLRQAALFLAAALALVLAAAALLAPEQTCVGQRAAVVADPRLNEAERTGELRLANLAGRVTGDEFEDTQLRRVRQDL